MHTFAKQVAKQAALVITSRVPIMAGTLSQHELAGISAPACQGLLANIAPNLLLAEVIEAVQLCDGVPLLLRRVGDVLRSGQVTIQVR